MASFLAADTPGAKPSFTVGWSVYAGWTPYHYLMQSGIMRKWADKYGITIKVQRFDYAPSLDAFVAKNIDACTMTNMEALDMPAASGVPTTAIIIGDYSNGNDALLVRNGLQLKDLPGKKLLLVQKTVSEYLLDRAMTMNGMRDQIKQVRLINTSDSDIATAFLSDASASATVTWKPLVSQIVKQKGITSLFNSSQIPGEILDLTVVRTEILNRPDGSGQKLREGAGGRVVRNDGADVGAGAGDGQSADRRLRRGRQDTLASYKEQLSTTKMFYTPQSAVEFGASRESQGKDGAGAAVLFRSWPAGIEYQDRWMRSRSRIPTGSVQGKADRVRFRFDISYMKMAAEGKL